MSRKLRNFFLYVIIAFYFLFGGLFFANHNKRQEKNTCPDDKLLLTAPPRKGELGGRRIKEGGKNQSSRGPMCRSPKNVIVDIYLNMSGVALFGLLSILYLLTRIKYLSASSSRRWISCLFFVCVNEGKNIIDRKYFIYRLRAGDVTWARVVALLNVLYIA